MTIARRGHLEKPSACITMKCCKRVLGMADNDFSWASEVEKEHEATGWNSLEDEDPPLAHNGSALPTYAPAPAKNKKGKKKKKQNSALNNQVADRGRYSTEQPPFQQAQRLNSLNADQGRSLPLRSTQPPVQGPNSLNGAPKNHHKEEVQAKNDWKPQNIGLRPVPHAPPATQTSSKITASAQRDQQVLPNDKGKPSANYFEVMSALLPAEKKEEDRCIEQPPRLVERAPLPLDPCDLKHLDSDSACEDDDFDNDSDYFDSDEYASDASIKSLDTRKCNKWFRSFFDSLDDCTQDQLMEVERQWHCPACQGGKGAIDWFGLQPLLAHAKTFRTKRVRLHRELAEVLELELERRHAGRGYIESKFGKWKGLREDNETTNPFIIWPPMVIIQNTRLDQDDQEKWVGMGNKELLEMFKDYHPMKARHSYGPQGHRGISLLIFAESPTGYLNAERLVKNFKDSNRGLHDWERKGKILFHPGGDRILYGYMATPEEMDIFNRHSAGKSKVKWERKRYQEAVLLPMRQMDVDNQELQRLKVKVHKQKEHSKTLEKTVSLFTKKLLQREQEISIIRERAREQHEENQKEMDDLELTYKQRIRQLARETAKREEEIRRRNEDFKQEHMERCQQLEAQLGAEQQQQQQAKVKEEIAKQTEIVECSLQDSEDYESQKRELMKKHHLRKLEFMRKQYEQALLFERELEKEREELLDKYRMQREHASSVTG